jgi:hypothetical protein
MVKKEFAIKHAKIQLNRALKNAVFKWFVIAS